MRGHSPAVQTILNSLLVVAIVEMIPPGDRGISFGLGSSFLDSGGSEGGGSGGGGLGDGSSLPMLSGQCALPALAAPATIHRDRFGIADIHAESFLDAIRVQGFAHAQDRYFQMDMVRRLAAGELAELIGRSMLESDRAYRHYRFRTLAKDVIRRLPHDELEVLSAYTEGVNAGLASSPAPPEYGLLNTKPEPWREEDSILAIYAMFDMLHMEASIEKQLGVMRDALPDALFEFLTPNATRFDAPLLPKEGNDWKPMPIPGPEVIDLRSRSAADLPDDLVSTQEVALGSNNWAVAGSRSVHGGAIVANDPHLQLTAPGIWYRTQLRWTDEHGEEQRVGGLSLPGLPGITIGSSKHIAWGFTNTMGDFQDLIIIEIHPENPHLYRSPDGYEPFGEIRETINIRGRGSETLTLRTTRWGIVTDKDHRGRPLVLKWTALEPDTIDLGMIDMLHARTLDEAVHVARTWSGPSQNVVIAHHDGGIAWVVSGYLPDRFGPAEYNGSFPTSWADGDRGWRGPLPEDQRPVLIKPDDGILFTANNRTVDPDRAQKLGGIWSTGERASRIAEMLRSKEKFTEDDLFQMQLDTRVKSFDFYRDLVLESVLEGDFTSELFREARDIIESWNGNADADQPALRLLNAFRSMLHTAVLSPLVAPCRDTSSSFSYNWLMREEPVRRVLEELPPHLLPRGYGSWESLITSMWERTVERLAAERDERGLHITWGETNTSSIAHPITLAMPAFANTLNMPAEPQSGHWSAVRVATPRFGASARMVISPGREHQGILHTPAGQSGHFQSPHYRDAHKYWAKGEKLPFLPGKSVNTLRLVPDS